jgi:peptidoglycan/LPS O-acetylase OafA/YrhL
MLLLHISLQIETKHKYAGTLVLEDSREGRLRELDGWRAVSVLLVIVHHIGGYQHARTLSHFPGPASVVHYCGPLGVKIFFFISGFVICRLLISEELRCGSVSLKAFYYRRIFRILPPLYFYLGVLSLLLWLGLIHESRRAVFDGVFFLHDIHLVPLVPQSWFVGHTWSLAVEEQFYLIFPTMWVLTPKAWKGQVFLGVFFLCAAWNLSMVYTGWDAVISSDTRAGFACIACGVLLAIHEGRVRLIVNDVPAFIVALAALTLLVHPVGSSSWQAALYECLLAPPAIGLVLLFSLGRGAWLRAFLCSKPVQAVGLTSYGIYLWQQLFTAPTKYFFGPGQIIPLLLPLLCLIVPLSYFLIEKPTMSYGKFLSRRTRKCSIDAKAFA